MTNAVESRCANCVELQRSLVRTLGDKRSLLTRLQKEQARTRKLSREGEKCHRKVSEAGRNSAFARKEGEGQSNINDLSSTTTEGEACLKWQVSEVMEVNKKWEEDYLTLRRKYETEKEILEEELKETKAKLANADTHVLALESEVTRLASTLNEMYQRIEASGTSAENREDYEVFRQQMQLYKEDFSHERRDRERAQSEKDHLQQQLRDAQQIIATLSQEVDIYKERFEQSQAESRQLRRHSVPPLNTSQPHLQIVYPITESTPYSAQWQRRQEQQRRGVLTRGANPPHTAPPSVFFGGDVEVDRDRM